MKQLLTCLKSIYICVDLEETGESTGQTGYEGIREEYKGKINYIY